MSNLASYKGLGAPAVRIVNLSTASTVVTITADNQGALNVWNGQSSASRFNLPAPEAGMILDFYFHSDAVSSGTKFVASSAGTYDFYLIDGTTAEVFAPADGSTVEGGVGVRLIALNDYRWVVDKWGASTLGFAATAGSTTT